jgi:hypothetical protein
VAGRAEPVAIHELLGLDGEPTVPDSETISRFESAVGQFRQGAFRDARRGFEEVRTRCGGKDGPSELYISTIDRLESEPPGSDWDGVINFATK